MNFVKRVFVLLGKDVLLELRTKEMFSAMLVFSLLVILIFNFSFEPGSEHMKAVAPGILWVAFVFAGVLGLHRSFTLEKEKDCLQGLMLCPIDRSAIYLGKILGNMTVMMVVEAATLLLFLMLFNLPILRLLPKLVVVVFLGTLGFASVGTLFSAMSVNTRAREVMLPVLLFSVIIPVVIIATKLTGYILADKGWSTLFYGLRMLLAFDFIFFTLSILTFEYIIEE
ncbi:MAG TPA: heme ABC transporter permease [Desulfobacterales bacterium]|nr:heme ABC transporter permease [Desulfobacterales bacterium]